MFRQRKKTVVNVFLIVVLSLLSGVNLFALTARDTLAPYWSRINAPMANDITFLKCDSSNILYMGIWGKGIGRSNNEGQSWVFNNTGLSNLYVNCFDIDSAGTFFACTNGGGVFRSTNNGLSWSEFNSGLTNKYVKAIAIKKGGPMFIGTLGGGVFRLKPGTSRWEQVTNGMWFLDVSALMITIEGSLIAGTNGDGLYRTDDNGDNWRRSSGGMPDKNITSIVMDDIGQYYCGTLGGGLYISVTMGVNWSVYKASSVILNVSGVAINKKREPVVALADYGIYRYDSEIYETWRKSNMTYASANCIVKMKSGNLFSGVASYGLFKSSDNGASWITAAESFRADTGVTPLLAMDGGFVMASDLDGKDVYISRDYGVSWTKTALPDSVSILSFGADSSGNVLVGTRKADSCFLMSSSNKGTSWSRKLSFKDTAVTAIGCKSGGLIMLGVVFPSTDPKNPDLPTSEILRSQDGGATWSHIAAKSPSDGFKFIKFNKKDGAVFTRFNNGLFRSVNDGTAWNRILDSTQMIEDIDFDSFGNIYVGTDQGLRKSVNNGGTWTSNKFGVTYARIKYVLVTRTNELYLGFSANKGVLRSYDQGTTFDSISNAANRSTVMGLTTSPEGMIYLSTNNLYRTIEPVDMIAASLVTPTDWQGGVALLPTLTWNSVPKATLYEMQIARDLDFKNIQEHIVTGDTQRTLVRTLEYNGEYVWRVRSRFNNSLGDWSPYRQFTTIIKYPELVSPIRNDQGLPTSVVCKWHLVPGSGAYIFQISKDANFSSNIIDKETTDTTMNVPGLDLFTKYYWRVRAKANKTFSDWSEVWNFTTKLKAPTLRAPANKSIDLDTIALLEWNPAGGATGYDVQIAKDSLFKIMIFEGETQNLSSHKTKLLEYFTTYYWRIRAKDEYSVSDWSTCWSFTTTIQSLLLLSPADKATDMLPDSIKFEWVEFPSALNFHIIIAKDAGFNQIVWNDSSYKGTFGYVHNFDYYSTYYWKMRIKIGKYSGLWSETRSFKTGIEAPKLNSPDNNTMDAKTEVIFMWETTEGATYYRIQIATDDKFSSIFADQDSLVFPRYTQSGLPYETKMYWRVLGQYEYGVSKWSEVRNFTTEEKNTEYVFDEELGFRADIFPNPAVNNINFRFEMKKPCMLKIEIYSLAGSYLGTVTDGNLEEGNYIYNWNCSSFAVGAYVYKIYAGGKEFNGIFNIIR